MTHAPHVALAALLGFAVGATPFALLIGRAVRGVDLREHGSGNPGASNAGRVLGARWGLLVFALDAAKGWLAAGPLALLLAPGTHLSVGLWVGLAGGLAATAGHCYSPWLRWDGGKGVATGVGVVLAWSWPVAAVGLALWALVAALTRTASIASLLAAVAVAVAGALVDAARWPGYVALVALIAWRHRGNLARLRRGAELSLGGDA